MYVNPLRPIIIIISSFLFLGTSNIHSQTPEWSLPFSITDSLTDNHNPHIAVYEQGNYSTGGIVFWEREFNDSTTAVWMRNLSYMSPEEEVFYQEGVHFRNLHFFQYYDYDTLFAIFYEANINGNFDIYMSKYSEDGNITDPQYVLGGEGDDVDMNVLQYEFVGWQVDGAIKVAGFVWPNSFTEAVTIDSLGCLNPSFGANTIVYEKTINDSSRIYYATYDYSQGWSEAIEFFSTGHNTSLEFEGANDPPFSINIFFWENYNGTEWRIYGADLDDLEIMDTEIVSDEPLFPDPIFIDLPVTEPQYVLISYLTFSKEENGAREIFANNGWGNFLDYHNISNHDAIDTKPYIEVGGSDYKIYIYDIWERYINGHWQLMASRLDLPVSVDENAPLNNANNLGLYPNPFSEQLNIQFSTLLDSDARVTIYNSSGIMVRSFNAGNNKHLAWDRNDDKGNPVPPGIYLLEITSGNVRSTGKVIVTN